MMGKGDILTLNCSEHVDPDDFQPGWDGVFPLAVTLRVAPGSPGTATPHDQLAVYDVANEIPIGTLGTINLLRRGYVANHVNFPATLVLQAPHIMITLGPTAPAGPDSPAGAGPVSAPDAAAGSAADPSPITLKPEPRPSGARPKRSRPVRLRAARKRRAAKRERS